MLFLRILLPGKTNGQMYSDSAQIFAKNTPILRTRYSQIHVAGVLQTGGKPSTWFPPERLVELCFNVELHLKVEKNKGKKNNL